MESLKGRIAVETVSYNGEVNGEGGRKPVFVSRKEGVGVNGFARNEEEGGSNSSRWRGVLLSSRVPVRV